MTLSLMWLFLLWLLLLLELTTNWNGSEIKCKLIKLMGAIGFWCEWKLFIANRNTRKSMTHQFHQLLTFLDILDLYQTWMKLYLTIYFCYELCTSWNNWVNQLGQKHSVYNWNMHCMRLTYYFVYLFKEMLAFSERSLRTLFQNYL